METLDKYINENIHEPRFGRSFTGQMHEHEPHQPLQKNQLHINLSPSKMINLVRLKKAAELLSNPSARLNEVAYSADITQLGNNLKKAL
ncbi:hypothetical protein [Niabella digestorum]|uniref:Uncharacterized protein n=1 Tax=Niabella digestorum TaxID=3117701 RepID=A0ABU7RGF1_9BACT